MESIWDIINIPMSYVMRFFNNIVGNQYLLALFLFAIFIEIILVPFGIKQQKNSIKQAKLRPKEMAIRKKYAGREDNVTKQKVTQEIQELYQKEGYSPLSGCLPLLIQMPIMIALYYIVLNPLKYICGFSTNTINQLVDVVKSFPQYAEAKFDSTRTIDLMDAIKEIGPDAFKNIEQYTDFVANKGEFPKLDIFGGFLNLAQTPSITSPSWLLLVPVLTFVVYFFSSKLTRKLTYQPTTADDPATGCSNKMMDWMMPLMSVYICFIVPAAVGVYWIFKSIIGVLKQLILKKAMPIPTFTEEDYKAAEKEYSSKSEKVQKPKSSGTKAVRSLHHIDDEDFADTAPAALERKKALEEAEKAEKEEKKAEAKSSLIAEAPLKDDTRPEKKKKAKKEDNAEEATLPEDSNDNENN